MDKTCASLLNVSTLSLALTLAACGGGGGTPTPIPDPIVVPTRTVSGTAAKGLLKGATVKMFAIGTDGKPGSTAIATGTTGADGTYSIKVPADVLAFVIEVSGGPGATSADEATGLDIPITATFKLRDIVKLASDASTTIEGSVSPLTEMIVQAAEKNSGGLTATNIADAKSGFAKVFGFDPEQVRPFNANLAAPAGATDAQKVQSLLLAGISQMAKDGKLGCAGSDSEKVACVVGKVGALGTLKDGALELKDDVRGELRQAFTTVTADPAVNKTGKASVEGLPAFSESKVPLIPGAPTGIEAAKKLFASLRTNMKALSNPGNTGALDIRADAFRADFDKAIVPLDPDLANWMRLTTQGIDYLRAYQAGTTTQVKRDMFEGSARIGGCSVFGDTTGTAVASSAANAVSVGCSIVRKTIPGSVIGNTFKQVTAAFTIVPTSSTTYTYVGRARIETYVNAVRDAAADVTVGTYGNASNRAEGSIEYAKAGNIISKLVVSGTMPARTDAFGVAITDREAWELSAVRTALDNKQFNYALSGSITSIKTDLPVGKISLKPGSFFRTEELNDGTIVLTGMKEFSLILAAEAGGSKLEGALKLADPMLDKSGKAYLPTNVSFTGTLGANNATVFVGTLALLDTGYGAFDTTLPESATNFTKKSASLVGTVSIPDRPPLKLSVSVGNDVFNGMNLSAQYDDGSNVINLSATGTVGGPRPQMKISSVGGVSLVLSATSDLADVLKDNAKVAVLNLKTGRIDYADGSFESLK
jgi:hypothetical protein